MSNLPPEELNEVEQTVEPVPIGLPKSLQNLNRQEMADYISTTLREWRPKDEQQPES